MNRTFVGFCCNNPSKWGLQQPKISIVARDVSCNNPSKWGLQQHDWPSREITQVVITPQNGVFNNRIVPCVIFEEVVITPQNGVFNNNRLPNAPYA